jgi:acyl carrier protein
MQSPASTPTITLTHVLDERFGIDRSNSNPQTALDTLGLDSLAFVDAEVQRQRAGR